MFFRYVIIALILLAYVPQAFGHHNAPEDMQDFITEQLIEADSPHLYSTDDDPSLSGVVPSGMQDVDYVVIADQLAAEEVMGTVEDIVVRLDSENAVCDQSVIINLDDDGTYSAAISVDYCE
jgi:hypothetical protein